MIDHEVIMNPDSKLGFILEDTSYSNLVKSSNNPTIKRLIINSLKLYDFLSNATKAGWKVKLVKGEKIREITLTTLI